MGADVEVVPASVELALLVAERMRDADRAEVWALARHTPEEAVLLSLGGEGERWCFVADGEVLAVFGCGAPTLLSPIGVPWLLGAVGVERHARAFLGLGRAHVARWSRRWDLLANLVDQRNAASIRWLRRLGFSFGPPVPVGPDALPFLPFCLRRHV